MRLRSLLSAFFLLNIRGSRCLRSLKIKEKTKSESTPNEKLFIAQEKNQKGRDEKKKKTAKKEKEKKTTSLVSSPRLLCPNTKEKKLIQWQKQHLEHQADLGLVYILNLLPRGEQIIHGGSQLIRR